MLLHIQPSLFSPFRDVALVDLTIINLTTEPSSMHLKGGVDLSTGRPYPNKRYAVACRKNKTRKAFKGIFLETAEPVSEFVTIARWAVNAEQIITHQIRFTLLDQNFDAASEDQIFWYACGADLGNWASRIPNPLPVQSRPVMEVLPREYDEREKPVTYDDTFDPKTGLIVKRYQDFSMPTIERERLIDSRLEDRLPPIDSAFVVEAQKSSASGLGARSKIA